MGLNRFTVTTLPTSPVETSLRVLLARSQRPGRYVEREMPVLAAVAAVVVKIAGFVRPLRRRLSRRHGVRRTAVRAAARAPARPRRSSLSGGHG